jgi:hypothetical protein
MPTEAASQGTACASLRIAQLSRASGRFQRQGALVTAGMALPIAFRCVSRHEAGSRGKAVRIPRRSSRPDAILNVGCSTRSSTMQ